MTESVQFPFLALAFVLSTMLGTAATYVVRGVARSRGWNSRLSDHHIHRGGIPRLGGVAVYVTFILFYGMAAVLRIGPSWHQELPVLLPASLLFLVGFVDDLLNMPARLKLAFQILCSIWLFNNGIHLFPSTSVNLHFGGLSVGPAVALIATVAWVLLITNAFNLIDGLDGLAAGSALFSIVTVFGLALAAQNIHVAYSAIILGGAVLGFLRYNFNPATIFLGDSGSLFIGFMLAGLALQPQRAAVPTLVAVTIPLIAFGLPIVETTVSVLRRFLSGRPLFSPDQDHMHHRLLRLGLSHRQAVIALYGLCAACALLSLFLIAPTRSLVGLILVVTGMMFCIVIQRLDYAEFREFMRLAQRTWEQKGIIANNVAIRKIARNLETCTSWAEMSECLEALLKIEEFDYYILSLADGLSLKSEAKLKFSRHKVRYFHTLKTDAAQKVHLPSALTIVLDLRSRFTNELGKFTIGRSSRQRSLLVDINILLSELEPALSRACERISRMDHEKVHSFPATRSTLATK